MPHSKRKTTRDDGKRKGHRLPKSLRKEVEQLNPKAADEEAAGSNDVYEFEEESLKNCRYDHVENLDYELPEDFKDEDVSSDDDVRMLRSENLSQGKKWKRADYVISEAYPVSEFNRTRQGADLVESLQGKSDYSKLRNKVKTLEKKSGPIPAPLRDKLKDQLERKAVNEIRTKDLRKWEPIVKRNRVAPTIYFNADWDLGPSTVGTIASEFKPRTKFEKEMALVLYDNEVMDAHRNDGSKLLELNKVSVEDERERQDRIAKMRSLLVLDEENPKLEKPVLLPGWGQWLGVQKKKGIPSYMQKEHETAKKKREEIVKQRKDAKFKHVIFPEKMPEKPANLFPSFTSEEVYKYSIRKPLAPESNAVIIDLYRSSVVKKSGVIIKPIKFEEVNAFQKPEEHKKTGQKKRKNKN